MMTIRPMHEAERAVGRGTKQYPRQCSHPRCARRADAACTYSRRDHDATYYFCERHAHSRIRIMPPAERPQAGLELKRALITMPAQRKEPA